MSHLHSQQLGDSSPFTVPLGSHARQGRAALTTGPSDARGWAIKKLRFRLFSTAARLVRTGRRVVVRLPERWPWTRYVLDGIARLHGLTAPT
ncbi:MULTISPECIES: transposase [Streptomycetaceae]|uniref:transposase n=1 Tax=Embleya scabrispora TaxID=159449 RepID=UPI0003763005|nr:hypothetical protein [Streptomyces sp. SID5474]